MEDILLELEEACTNPTGHESPGAIIGRVTRTEAGWLARAIREKLIKDKENMAEEIEKELQVR